MTTEYSGSGDVSRSLELLWGLRERPSRGPKPGLTLDRIVEAAIAVADAEGLAAVSMRRVAAELDVGTMSLYRYVPGKHELLDLMLDKVAEPGTEFLSTEELGWREVLDTAARATWKMCLAHPWYPQVDQGRPLLGPSNLTGLEFVLRNLRRTGIGDQQMMMVIVVVDAFVTAVARGYVNSQQAEQRTGVSDEEFWAAQEHVLVKVMGSGAYPSLAQMADDSFGFSHEQLFEFGLRHLLDGLSALFDHVIGGASGPWSG